MINKKYLIGELTTRKRRSIIQIGLTGLVVATLIAITLLTGALEQAFQAPLTDIGANITVQKSGDVPEQMAGPVLPCSVAPITHHQRQQIAQLPGVRSISQALLFWDFSDDQFQIVVGMNPDDTAGPALLHTAVLEGRMFTQNERSVAMAETVWANQNDIQVGATTTIGGKSYTIIGLVDASQLSHISAANLYIPLQEAQQIATTAQGVAEVHTFDPKDSNILFIQADRDKAEDLSTTIQAIVGEKAVVSTPNSFKQLLGSLFSLTERFGTVISGLIFILALLLIVRNTKAALLERTKEIGTLKAVGWTTADIRSQLLAETGVYVLLGTGVGILVGVILAWTLSTITIAIPIPWDMAPTPHFLPGGDQALFKDVRLQTALNFEVLLLCGITPLVIALAAAWSTSKSISSLQTSEVLRYE